MATTLSGTMEDSGIDSDPKPAVNINRTNNERILMVNKINNLLFLYFIFMVM